MKIDEIMATIRMLACSQGSYGRLLAELENEKEYSPDTFADTVAVLEEQNFSGPLDLIMFLEG